MRRAIYGIALSVSVPLFFYISRSRNVLVFYECIVLPLLRVR